MAPIFDGKGILKENMGINSFIKTFNGGCKVLSLSPQRNQEREKWHIISKSETIDSGYLAAQGPGTAVPSNAQLVMPARLQLNKCTAHSSLWPIPSPAVLSANHLHSSIYNFVMISSGDTMNTLIPGNIS